MAALVKQIDQMLGCIPRTLHTHADSSSQAGHSHSHEPQTAHQLLHSLPPSSFPSTMDIQEKYVDRSMEYNAHERDKWKAEGEELMKKASEMERRKAMASVKQEQSGQP